jgi:hypothetical protein
MRSAMNPELNSPATNPNEAVRKNREALSKPMSKSCDIRRRSGDKRRRGKIPKNTINIRKSTHGTEGANRWCDIEPPVCPTLRPGCKPVEGI